MLSKTPVQLYWNDLNERQAYARTVVRRTEEATRMLTCHSVSILVHELPVVPGTSNLDV